MKQMNQVIKRAARRAGRQARRAVRRARRARRALRLKNNANKIRLAVRNIARTAKPKVGVYKPPIVPYKKK
jgi:hypothetical protein